MKDKPVKVAEARPAEDLIDIEGADSLQNYYGARFNGWYLFKIYLNKQSYPLNYKDTDVSYDFDIFDYNIRFIMPPFIEFSKGSIPYSDDERRLGVFRFPKDTDGKYKAGVPKNDVKKQLEKFKNLSEKELRKMLENSKVLTFEAFRIPQHGFEYISLSDKDVEAISKLTDPGFAKQLKSEYDNYKKQKMTEVKERILSGCDYLLILKQVLDLEITDLEEASKITDGIIHE